VLLANGLPTESWRDTGIHRGFENPPAPALRAMLPRHPGAPVVETGPILDQVRAHLTARAIELGYRPRRTYDLVTEAGLLTGTIPAGTQQLRLRSLAGPPQIGPDRRQLGAAIRRITLGGRPVALDDPRLQRGFHPIDREGDATWRWTEAEAILAVDARRKLPFTIDIVAVSHPTDTPREYDIDLRCGGVRRWLIPAGTQTVRLHSGSFCHGRDRRALGTAIHGLRLDGHALALDDPRMLRGFHPVETASARAWRWTGAEAAINLAAVTDTWLELDIVALSAAAAA
jgi:hypothetical protein